MIRTTILNSFSSKLLLVSTTKVAFDMKKIQLDNSIIKKPKPQLVLLFSHQVLRVLKGKRKTNLAVNDKPFTIKKIGLTKKYNNEIN